MTLDYITLTPEELGKLLSAGSGEAALVYLYMKSTGDVTLKQAEQQLNMPMQNLGWAESLLKRLGLMDAVVPKARFDRQQAPVYTGEEVTAFSARDPGFQLLQGEVSRRMGRVLTTEELKTLLSLRARRSVAAPATAPVRTRVRYVPSITEHTAPVESSIKTMVAGTLGRPRLGLSGYTETIFTPRADAPGA